MADKYRIKEHLDTVYDKELVEERIEKLQKIVDRRKRGGKVISEHKQTGRQHQWLIYYVKE
jgi:hypothetical protein